MSSDNTSPSPSTDTGTIVTALARHVREQPSHQVLRWVDNTCNVVSALTYKDLWEQSLSVSYLLERKGVQKGDRVMIAYPFGLEFLAGMFGCMMTGVIACSVYPPNPKQLKVDIPIFNLKASDAGSKFALTTISFKRLMGINNFIGNSSQVEWLASTVLCVPPKSWVPCLSVEEISPNDIAFIQYTSGSTGCPKGVMISHRSLLHNVIRVESSICDLCPKDPKERAEYTGVSWLPQYHDLGLIGFFFATIYTGTNGVACSPLDFILKPILWHEMVVKYKCRLTTAPNFSFGLLLKHLKHKKQSFQKWTAVDRVLCGAEPVNPEVMDEVISVLGVKRSNLLIGYGCAEVGLIADITPYCVLDGLVACLDTKGAPIACVVNEQRQKVADGIIGEVFIQLPNQVAQGYWGNAEATQRTFVCSVEHREGDWLATGDMGKAVGSKIYITGRLKEVIIINGRKFFPNDIERVVEKEYSHIIRPGCVAAHQYSSCGIGLVADLRKGAEQGVFPTAAEIVHLLVHQCQVQTVYICLLKAHGVPKTTSGKIKRMEVRDTSMAGTWPRKLIAMEWKRPQNLQRELQSKGIGSSLQKKLWESPTEAFASTVLPNFSNLIEENLEEQPGHTFVCPLVENSSSTITVEEITSEIITLISSEVGHKVDEDALLEDLGLSSLVISAVHNTLLEKYSLENDDLPVSVFFHGASSVHHIAGRVKIALQTESHNNCAIYDNCERGAKAKLLRYALVLPVIDTFIACVTQLLAIAIPAAFMSLTVFPAILVYFSLQEILSSWALIAALPLLYHIHAVCAALLLVLLKWTLVGRQKVGHAAVWSSQFAARWIVKKCARLVWTYSLWGLMGKTELMNIIHRCLGCNVGCGASIEPGCIIDFDLVAIGEGSIIDKGSIIETSIVSLGVQTLEAINLGRGCFIEVECCVERGAVIRDGVKLAPKTHVPPFSSLEANSSYQGKPAQLVRASHVESKQLPTDSPSPLTFSGKMQSTSPLNLSRTFAVFVLTPCLWLTETGAILFIGGALYSWKGSIGVAVFFWMPPTCVWVVLVVVSIIAKKLLLGHVKPGVWPRGGCFEARKYILDHLIEEHQLRWKTFAKQSGSFFAGSLVLEIMILKWLGVKIGSACSLYNTNQLWTQYDLLSVGSRVVAGDGVMLKAWNVTAESLFGASIEIQDDSFLGANSVIVSPARCSKGCSVASYSVMQNVVEQGQTVVGCKAYQTVFQEDLGAGASNIVLREVGNFIGVAGVWLGVGLLVWIVSLMLSYFTDIGVELMNLELALGISFFIGFLFVILIPAYLVLMMWAAKAFLVGRYTAGELSNNSTSIILEYSFDPNFTQQFCAYTAHSFGGTMIEKWQWALLGMKIGCNVYLDSIFASEPDLVSIGDFTSITKSYLTSHNVDRRRHMFGPITIGNHCTIGPWCNIQMASLEDDTDLVGYTMPLTGALLKSGTWVGYPAKRIGEPSQPPPRPPRDIWLSLLLNPLSTLFGSVCVLTLPIYILWNNQRQMKNNLENLSGHVQDISGHIQGTFQNSKGQLTLSFASVKWHQELRVAMMPAGTYMTGPGWWWKVASYEFETSKRDEYVGHTILGGWWYIPESFLKTTLCRDGKDLVWIHSWFTGDAMEKLRFIPCEIEAAMQTEHSD